MKDRIFKSVSLSRYGFALVFVLMSFPFSAWTQEINGASNFFASFRISDGHGAPLLLELGLKTGGPSRRTEAFVLDSRLDPEVKIQVLPYISSVMAQEVRQQEKPFERWQPRARASVSAQCRQVLELSLRDGEHSGTWFYCVDLAEKDPQAAVARRWLNFVDESLRSQIHPMIREQRAKEKRK